MNIYDYQRPLGKIDDIPALRNSFVAIYDTKTKKDMVRFAILYGKHLLELTGYSPIKEILASFDAMQEWLDEKTNYHPSRNLSFEIHRIAGNEKDPVKARFYRTMAQIAASPHVKYHALWATDFGVTLINRMHPKNMAAVTEERKTQIALLEKIY